MLFLLKPEMRRLKCRFSPVVWEMERGVFQASDASTNRRQPMGSCCNHALESSSKASIPQPMMAVGAPMASELSSFQFFNYKKAYSISGVIIEDVK